MALVLKPGKIRDSTARNNPTPDEMLPSLPQNVLERFPELDAWQMQYRTRFNELRDALERRQEANDDALAALAARVSALE